MLPELCQKFQTLGSEAGRRDGGGSAKPHQDLKTPHIFQPQIPQNLHGKGPAGEGGGEVSELN